MTYNVLEIKDWKWKNAEDLCFSTCAKKTSYQDQIIEKTEQWWEVLRNIEKCWAMLRYVKKT